MKIKFFIFITLLKKIDKLIDLYLLKIFDFKETPFDNLIKSLYTRW